MTQIFIMLSQFLSGLSTLLNFLLLIAIILATELSQ